MQASNTWNSIIRRRTIGTEGHSWAWLVFYWLVVMGVTGVTSEQNAAAAAAAAAAAKQLDVCMYFFVRTMQHTFKEGGCKREL